MILLIAISFQYAIAPLTESCQFHRCNMMKRESGYYRRNKTLKRVLTNEVLAEVSAHIFGRFVRRDLQFHNFEMIILLARNSTQLFRLCFDHELLNLRTYVDHRPSCNYYA